MNRWPTRYGMVGLLLVLGAGASCHEKADPLDAEGKFLFRLSLKEGETYKLRVVSHQEITQTLKGQEQRMTQEMGMGTVFHVEEVGGDGTARVKITYHSANFKQDSPMGKIEYDSTAPSGEVPLQARGFHAMVGKSFFVILSPMGRVKAMEGAAELLEAVIDAFDLPEGRMKEDMVRNLEDQFGEEPLKEVMENLIALFPEEPIGIGDSWSNLSVLGKGFPMILENTWTLKDRKDGVAVLGVQSLIKPNPLAGPLLMGPLKVRYTLDGRQEGILELEEASGMIVGGSLAQRFSGQIRMDGPSPGLPDDPWPISVEAESCFETFQ